MKKEALEKIRTVDIHEEPIELYKIMKLGNLAGSGGEAKAFVGEGLVKVNGTLETRKRRKILSGDMIEFEGERIQVKLI